MSNRESMMEAVLPEYYEMKAQHQDAVLFWRTGDFYKVFLGDAVVVAGCLNTTLLFRQGVPTTGWPWHSVSVALARMVKAGYKVAVCEPGKGHKKYEVARVVSPGLNRARVEAAPPLPKPEEGNIFERMNRKLSEVDRRLDRLVTIAERTGQEWRPRPALRVIQGGGNTTPITVVVTRHKKPLP